MTSPSRRLFITAAGIAAALALAACGSSSGGSSLSSGSGSSNSSSVGTPASHGSDVLVATTNLGPVLVDGSKRTLYLLTADRTSLACTGSCLTIWSPLLVAAGQTPNTGPGVSGALGTVDRQGRKQITISGHPLYTYTGGAGSGQTNGQGIQSFGGVWYTVGATGAPVTSSGGAAPSPSSNGYNY